MRIFSRGFTTPFAVMFISRPHSSTFAGVALDLIPHIPSAPPVLLCSDGAAMAAHPGSAPICPPHGCAGPVLCCGRGHVSGGTSGGVKAGHYWDQEAPGGERGAVRGQSMLNPQGMVVLQPGVGGTEPRLTSVFSLIHPHLVKKPPMPPAPPPSPVQHPRPNFCSDASAQSVACFAKARLLVLLLDLNPA